MRTDQFEVRKLTPTIGAEVLGIDLSVPLNFQQVGALRKILLDNLVIFFRDQNLSVEQHKAFGRYFGKLHIHPAITPAIPEHPEILVIENIKAVVESWHTDVSCETEPPMGSILYMHEIPANGGGDTNFASMYAAFEDLSGAMQRFLEGLTAIHDGGPIFRTRDSVDPQRKNSELPFTEHPVIRTHPETGRKCLYVNSIYTKKIPQLKPEESDNTLRYLFRHIERSSHIQCRFKWRAKSMAFWDNRCAQHQPIWDYRGQRRYGHRVTLCGDRPFLQS